MKTQFISKRLYPSHCWLKSSRRRTFVPQKSNWIIGSWWQLWKVLQPALSTLRRTKACDMAGGGWVGGLALSIQHSFSCHVSWKCRPGSVLSLHPHFVIWSHAGREDRCRRLFLSHRLCCSSTSQIHQRSQLALYYVPLRSGWYFIDHREWFISLRHSAQSNLVCRLTLTDPPPSAPSVALCLHLSIRINKYPRLQKKPLFPHMNIFMLLSPCAWCSCSAMEWIVSHSYLWGQ